MSTGQDDVDLVATYRDYIATLNSHRMRSLDPFVAEALTYNAEAMTRSGYEDLLADDLDTFPDLHFDVREVVVQGDRLAARIHFVCRPVRAWRGRPPDGRRVRFDEHVFYRFSDGRIVEVHSVISAAEEVGS